MNLEVAVKNCSKNIMCVYGGRGGGGDELGLYYIQLIFGRIAMLVAMIVTDSLKYDTTLKNDIVLNKYCKII